MPGTRRQAKGKWKSSGKKRRQSRKPGWPGKCRKAHRPTQALERKEKERKELEKAREESKSPNAADQEASPRAGDPTMAPGEAQEPGVEEPVEVEMGDGQENEPFEVWLEKSKRTSEEKFQKALDEASNQGNVRHGRLFPPQE
eukprot:3186974-Heterocapsa_arctica.AAC.1